MSKLRWMIYVQPLNRIIAVMVLLVLLWGILGSKIDKKWWKAINVVAFLGSVVAVFYMTVTMREAGAHEVILTPFQSFVEAKEQPEMYRSMLMNVFLFVPLGLSLPNALPRKWHPMVNACLTIILGFALSAVIEWCQYRNGLGRCEVDDVIMNTLGTVIGTSSFLFARMILRFRGKTWSYQS